MQSQDVLTMYVKTHHKLYPLPNPLINSLEIIRVIRAIRESLCSADNFMVYGVLVRV